MASQHSLLTKMQGQELDPRDPHLHCHHVHVRRGPNGLITFASDRDAGSGIGSQRSSLTLPPSAREGIPMASQHSLLTGMQGQELDPRHLHLHCHHVHVRRGPNGLITFASVYFLVCVCVGGFLDFILTILLLLTPPPNSGHFGLFMLIKQRGCVFTHSLLVS